MQTEVDILLELLHIASSSTIKSHSLFLSEEMNTMPSSTQHIKIIRSRSVILDRGTCRNPLTKQTDMAL